MHTLQNDHHNKSSNHWSWYNWSPSPISASSLLMTTNLFSVATSFILFVHLFHWLHSTYEWNHIIFIFEFLFFKYYIIIGIFFIMTFCSSLNLMFSEYFPCNSVGKDCLQCRRPGFDPWVGKIPWRRKWSTHSSILAWKISWTEEPGGLQSMGLQRVGHDWATNTYLQYLY